MNSIHINLSISLLLISSSSCRGVAVHTDHIVRTNRVNTGITSRVSRIDITVPRLGLAESHGDVKVADVRVLTVQQIRARSDGVTEVGDRGVGVDDGAPRRRAGIPVPRARVVDGVTGLVEREVVAARQRDVETKRVHGAHVGVWRGEGLWVGGAGSHGVGETLPLPAGFVPGHDENAVFGVDCRLRVGAQLDRAACVGCAGQRRGSPRAGNLDSGAVEVAIVPRRTWTGRARDDCGSARRCRRGTRSGGGGGGGGGSGQGSCGNRCLRGGARKAAGRAGRRRGRRLRRRSRGGCYRARFRWYPIVTIRVYNEPLGLSERVGIRVGRQKKVAVPVGEAEPFDQVE